MAFKSRRKIVQDSEFEKLDIVLQGQFVEFTEEVIENYSNLPFVNQVILSCWKDDNVIFKRPKEEGLNLCFNQKPDIIGDDNINLQIVSSFNGLKKVSTEYAIKMRTDQLYDYDSMIRMYQFFIEHRKEHRVFVSGMYPHLLFHPKDTLFWGKTEDLISIFDIPLKRDNVTEKVRIKKEDLWKYYGHFVRAETYIGANYCSNFDERVKLFLIQSEKYLYDHAPNWEESYEVSNQITKELFKSFPREGVDLKWPKKGWESYPYDDQKYGYNECWHEDGS